MKEMKLVKTPSTDPNVYHEIQQFLSGPERKFILRHSAQIRHYINNENSSTPLESIEQETEESEANRSSHYSKVNIKKIDLDEEEEE